MENIKKLKPTTELWIKIKWMANYAKPAIPFLIFSIIVNVIFSLIGIYNVTVSKSLIDSAISGDSKQTIHWLIIMLVITLISMLSSPVTSFMSTHSSTKLTQNIQRKIYQHIQCSDWLEQSKFHSVSLLTRVTSDVSNISSAILGTIPSLVSLTVTLVGSFYTLINWAPSIAFVAVFIGPFLILVGRYFSGKLKSLYKESQEEDVKYRSFMQESIQNIMIVKTFCMEKINMRKLLEIQDNKYKIAMRNTKLSAMTSMSMSFCSSLAYFSIFTWGVLNIAKGLMEIETIPVEKMADENELNDITNKSLDEIAVDNITNFESTLFNNPDIIFDNVYFAYKDNNYILNKINLTIDSGETIAFVGPSGEGKTTMIRLILSLINPTKGNLFISENNLIKDMNRNFRNLISYVPQGNTLFSGTIRSNLLYGKPDATDDEIKEALTNACAIDFVNELEDGLDTMIGEKGVGISEGQAQRIAIARAFLRVRPILILDEATSSLDPETEVKVLKSVKSLSSNPTCIIITHRPSALNICNRIMKLEKGHIREVSRKSILEVANELV